MCGIAGILKVTPPGEAATAISRPMSAAIPEAWLDILDESIKHRGPDGQGRFRDRAVRADGSVVDVALVHRRLSIIDHAGGAQPMVSAPSASEGLSACGPALLFHGKPNDPVWYQPVPGSEVGTGLVAVVFNGCIYNHRHLRRELQAVGHEFVTDHSDTEVLLHGWRQWHTDLPERLRGMIATAIWDRQRAALLLFRSSPGEKPLYRATSADESIFAFGSYAAALARLGMVTSWQAWEQPKDLLPRWLAFGHLSDKTPIPGVDQPRFGYITGSAGPSDEDLVEFEEGDRMRGGDPELASSIVRSARNGTLVDRIDDLIATAVRDRLEADVPVGCLLSGGVDSSLVAVHAVRHAAGLTTVCVRMPDARYDESRYAKRAAEVIGSRHYTIDVSARPAEDLVRLISTLGLPFGDSSLLATYWACAAVRREVGVALSGDGGDELFFGYERYRAADWMLLVRDLSRLSPCGLLPRTDPKSWSDKLARLLVAARVRSSASLLAVFQHPELRALLGSEAVRRVGWGINFGCDAARRLDLYSNLQSDMLRKVDTASLAAGLEVRSPLLDQTLIMAVHDFGGRELMPRGQRKGLLRQVARKYLPAEIVDRPKMGFAIPIGEWFRSDYGGMRTLLRDRLSCREPFGPDSLGINSMISIDYVRQMLQEHDDAGVKSLWPWKGRDHSQRLYMLLVLSIWADWMGEVQSGKATHQHSST